MRRSLEQIEPVDVLNELQPPPVIGRAWVPLTKTHTASPAGEMSYTLTPMSSHEPWLIQ